MAYTARSQAEVKEFFDTPEELQKNIKRLAHLVKKSKCMVAYTGAGISTACGIADYRSGINTALDTGAGKWAKNAAIADGKLKKGQATSQLPKKSSFKCFPSASHMALIALAKAGHLKHLVSQNTDGLHRRSGFPLDQLSELHGNGTLEDCPECFKVYMRDFKCRQKNDKNNVIYQNPTARNKLNYVIREIKNDLDGVNSKISDFLTDKQKKEMKNFIHPNKIKKYGDKSVDQRKKILKKWQEILEESGLKIPRYLHRTGRLCTVKGCGGKLQDSIINFGENLPEKPLQTAQDKSDLADLYLVLGSSCTVTPAADMPEGVGEKWKDELADEQEPVHNLVICNLQKTPLHHLCSLPVHCKIDDLMIGLMKELKLEIPKWYLERYININITNITNDKDKKKLCISGIDRDGTNFTVFKSVKLRNNGKNVIQVIDNKNKIEGEYNYIVPVWNKLDLKKNDDDNNNNDEKKNDDLDDKSNGLNIELTFYSNYKETKLVICLNEYLDEFINNEGNAAIKMIWDPVNQVWNVPNKKQQLNDKNIKLLWSIGKDKKDKEDKDDEQELKNDE